MAMDEVFFKHENQRKVACTVQQTINHIEENKSKQSSPMGLYLSPTSRGRELQSYHTVNAVLAVESSREVDKADI